MTKDYELCDGCGIGKSACRLLRIQGEDCCTGCTHPHLTPGQQAQTDHLHAETVRCG